MNIRKYTIRKT